jgi:hypothetical protein
MPPYMWTVSRARAQAERTTGAIAPGVPYNVGTAVCTHRKQSPRISAQVLQAWAEAQVWVIWMQLKRRVSSTESVFLNTLHFTGLKHRQTLPVVWDCGYSTKLPPSPYSQIRLSNYGCLTNLKDNGAIHWLEFWDTKWSLFPLFFRLGDLNLLNTS